MQWMYVPQAHCLCIVLFILLFHVVSNFTIVECVSAQTDCYLQSVRTELGHSIDQHGVNLQLLQDRVETNANMLVERLYSQVQVRLFYIICNLYERGLIIINTELGRVDKAERTNFGSKN